MRQLRIATIGDYTKYFSYFLMGTAQGTFLNGHLHYAINIRQHPNMIEEQLKYFKPHLVFCHMIFSEHLKDARGFLDREPLHEMLAKTKRKLGFKVAYGEGDAKKQPRYPYPATELIDLGLINSKLYQNFQSILSVPCIHWPYFAVNQNEINVSNKKFEYSAIFAGNFSNRSVGHLHYGRERFLTLLRKKIPGLKLFPDEEIGNTKFCSQEIASSADCVVGINQGFDVEGYLDTRAFQYIGAGGLFFMDPSPAMDLFFEPNIHYVPYERHNATDFASKYQYYMEQHRDKNKEIRKNGFEYVQKWHSAKRRVQMVIDILLNGKTINDYPIYLLDIKQYEKDEEKRICLEFLDRGLMS